jgi:hypothetical protein
MKEILKRLMGTVLVVTVLGCGLMPHGSAETVRSQQYQIDPATLDRIKSEAQDHSQVGDFVVYLADVYGPRMTGSPNYRAAGDWAIKTLQSFGLQDIHRESLGEISFAPGLKWSGRGWTCSRCSVRMVEPQQVQLLAAPVGWSRSTNGKVTGDTILAPFPNGPGEAEQYITKFRGKLKGKIVFISSRARIQLQTSPEFSRYRDDELAKLALPPETRPEQQKDSPANSAPSATPRPEPTMQQVLDAWNRLLDFLHDEGVLALVQAAGGQGGTLFTANQIGPPDPHNDPPPSVSLAAEQYNRLLRLKEKDISVKLEIELETQSYRNPDHFNVIADIPGSSKKDEVVFIGAHLDSWFGGTGATDNAAGVAVVMEAMRILNKLGLKMNRTVRMALWDAEELNASGSKAYVAEHLIDGKTGARKPLHEKLSVYFNIDNGAGKIRGIYLQSNKAAIPIFETWLRPLKELSATTVSIRDSGGSDHEVLDQAGIPAFGFIQDPLNYYSRTHHSTMDMLDYVPADDLKQSAAVLAALVYEAANNPVMVPRKPLPRSD